MVGAGNVHDLRPMHRCGLDTVDAVKLNFDFLSDLQVAHNGRFFLYQKTGPVSGQIFELELIHGNSFQANNGTAVPQGFRSFLAAPFSGFVYGIIL